jgi:hypothetical protein
MEKYEEFTKFRRDMNKKILEEGPMRSAKIATVVSFCLAFALAAAPHHLSARQATASKLDDFKFTASPGLTPPPIVTPGRFHGYTNYWHSLSWNGYQYGNLFQMSLPDVADTILQNKVDIAEELGIPGLWLEEGFLDGLLASPRQELNLPTLDALDKKLAAANGNLLVYAGTSSETGRRLAATLGLGFPGLAALKSHQFNAAGFHPVHAFFLDNGARRLFAVLSDDPRDFVRFKDLVRAVETAVRLYDFHRGWFATGTLLHSVTCFPGHPLEVIAKGLAQGNDWFTFDGYMDYLLQEQLPEWLTKAGLTVVADVGSGKSSRSLGTLGFGLSNWDGFKIQDTPLEKDWIKYVKDRAGWTFRPVFAPECDTFKYDGVIAVEGNKRQVDAENAPFILPTGMIRDEAAPCMVLFTEKGTRFTRETMYRAILGRRAVGVLPQGKMIGPAPLRNALQILLLDRIFLERRFGDQVQVTAEVASRNRLEIRIANLGPAPLNGTLIIQAAPELSFDGGSRVKVTLTPGTPFFKALKIKTKPDACGRVNPIQVRFEWKDGAKRTLAIADLPRAISAHQLLYGQAPEVLYPVSVYNYSETPKVPIEVAVFREGAENGKPVHQEVRESLISPADYSALAFKLPLAAGNYRVRVKALGTENWSQLGVEAASGAATLTELDLNKDGIMEYRLENAKVRVTLLAIGARVIEYFVKDRSDNILFKLWPKKETSTDRKPFRERGFYPYGGFEDFLGQASIETHKVYDAEVVKRVGACVQVRMRADFYGNLLEKTFTLYGNSPLLEVRFALAFRNPELKMLGPQPILELGRAHGPEDAFFVPTTEGVQEFRMRPEEYYGRVLALKEGWNAGYDTKEDIAFVGAFPVSEPEFLHMWMNHPSNGESNHYYVEFQPWVPITQKTVRYFSYYLWGAAGDWEKALEEMRARNLITTR